MSETAISIGELSRRTGCNIETVRYYERIGLIPRAARRGRYRSYGAADIDRLRFVRRARELGITLSEISALLKIAAAGQVDCAEAREIAAAHLAGVRKRLADLRRMERALAAIVEACNRGGGQAGCPLIDTLSATR